MGSSNNLINLQIVVKEIKENGSVPFDSQVEKYILRTNPLLLNEKGNKATMSIYEIVLAFLESP